MTSLTSVNDSDYNVTLSSDVGSYERFVTVIQTTVIAVISSGIILSNIINLIVLVSGQLDFSSSTSAAPTFSSASSPAHLLFYRPPPTGGPTATSGVKCPELLTERHVLYQCGASP